MKNKFLLHTMIAFAVTTAVIAQQWQSKIVYFDSENKLTYVRDDEGNTIPDFSYAGYKNGNDSIPFVPVVKTISPVEGDNTNHINCQINISEILQ